MNTELLKKKILQLAMQGKLVEQDESDGTAEELIDQILEEKKKLMAEGKIKKEKLSRIYKNPTDNHYYEKFEDGKIIDISNLIPFSIPNNWSWTRLKSIFQFINGDRGKNYPSKEKLLIDGKIPFISAINMENNSVKKEGLLFVSDEQYNKLRTGKLQKNDFVFCLRGSLGKHCKYNYDTGAIASSLVILRKIGEILDDYISLYLDSPLITQEINSTNNGTAQPNLGARDVMEYLIPVPPLQEQCKIVKKIENLISNINQIEKSFGIINANKKILKAKIIDLAIKGKLTQQLSTDEPSSKLIEKIVDEKHKLMKEGKIKKENLSIIYKDADNQFYEKFDDGKIVNITKELPFKIPTGWSWSRLRNIGIYKKGPFGSSLIKDMFVPKSNNTIKVYEQKNAINKDYTLGNYYITKQYFEQAMRGFEVEPGDIIVSCAGTIGETYILPSDIEKGIINQALMKMKIFNNINIDFFLMYFDQILKKESIKNGKGTAMKNIPPFAVFKEYLIPIPSQEEQERIIEKKISIFNYIKTAE